MNVTAPRNLEALKELLRDLFDLPNTPTIDLVYDRYRCLNYRVSAGERTYFLKQYRGRTGEEVFETKFAERYFAQHGLPIILPVQDHFGRPAFLYEDEWYSLFPFIEAQQPEPGALTNEFLEELGKTLAKLHRVGSLVHSESFRRLRLWDVNQFLFEMIDLKMLLERSDEPPRLSVLVRETLQKKIDFVCLNHRTPSDFSLPFNCLLHGDPIYQNTFLKDDGSIAYMFDLEDACIGPRAYEVARAVLINCFEDGWNDKAIEKSRIFYRAYQKEFPLELDQFEEGLNMYMIKNAHKLWFEAKHLFDDREEIKRCYEAHAGRVEHLEDDIKELAKTIASG